MIIDKEGGGAGKGREGAEGVDVDYGLMWNTFPQRRALLQMLASLVLVWTTGVSFGLSKDEESREKAGPSKAGPGKADGEPGKVKNGQKGEQGAAKKGKSAVLTVAVIGAGKPIARAEVKVKFPASVGGETTLPTNQAGEATFNSAGTGTAEVRVIVTGWESALQEVVLKEGSQRLTITLNSLPGTK